MGKPLGDDLRRKLLFAYDQGEGTLEELASRFVVSLVGLRRFPPHASAPVRPSECRASLALGLRCNAKCESGLFSSHI